MNTCNTHVIYIHIQHSARKANLKLFGINGVHQRRSPISLRSSSLPRLLFPGHGELQIPGTYLPQECLAHLTLHALENGQHSTEQRIWR